jgi:Big-like domain-containing protein
VPSRLQPYMSCSVTAKRQFSVLAVIAALLLACPGSVSARTYTVVSCNSALVFGSNASAWAAYSNAGSTYETCPSNGALTAGVSNRMTGQRYSGFQFSGHAFNAPPGTSITSIRWGGRIARSACYWGTFMRAVPSGAKVLGLANGEHCTQTDFDITNYPITYPVPPGTTRLEQMAICGASSCDAGAAMHSHSLEVTIDDPQPPSISLSGRMVSGQWVSGIAGNAPDLHIGASDGSGIQKIETALGSQRPSQSYGCNWSLTQPCPNHPSVPSAPSVGQLPDGQHTLAASAVDAAGNASTITRDVYVDNTPPDPVVPEIQGGNDWRQVNGYRASWPSAPNTAAPIVRVHWKVCTPEGQCPTTGDHPLVGPRAEIPDLRVPGPGEYRLHIWLEDAAGNQREANAALSVPLRFDPEAPSLSFLAPDPTDPLRVAVAAVDHYSGVASGEIEMRSTGSSTWHGLLTAREGNELVAYVDDERFKNGLYEFRAHAVDHAGNEASTVTRTDGAVASLRLPARIDTRLSVGVPWQRSRRRSGGLAQNVSVAFGQRIRLRGHRANADGQPIDSAPIEALEARPGGPLAPIGLATTDSRGWFRYVLKATRNRQIRFRYGGSRRIGAAAAQFQLRVPALTSIATNRRMARNGDSVQFSGRVATRPIPPAGKLLEMQAFFRGRWRTFSTLRTKSSGRWRFPYRFGATLGRVTYKFRSRLPAEGGYPYTGGNSRVVRIVVLGP